MSISETISPLIGRWALAWFYLVGLQHLTRQFGAVAGQLAAHHVPVPQLVLLVAAVLLFMGVLSLAFGYHTRHGAILLFGMTLAVAVMMHDYLAYRRSGTAPGRVRDFRPRCGDLRRPAALGGHGPGALRHRQDRRQEEVI